jgi:2-methylcitrate dehydratase PrpD
MRRVLRLDGELERLLLVEVVALQEPVERVEAELARQRLLDQLAVALAGARAGRRPGAAARAGSGSSAASVRG